MTDLQLLTAAGFGAVAVIIVSVLDFHVPYRISEIRNAVLRERYWFALAVYATIALILYFLVLISVVPVVLYLTAEQDDPFVTVVLAIPPAIAAVFAIPHIPLLRDVAAVIRRAMQSLARYPQTVETVTAFISRSSFQASDRAIAEVAGELERYGVSKKVIDDALADNNKVLAVGATKMIQQICSLHISFHDLRDDRRFKRFFAVHKDVFDDLEKHYRRVLRRSARALLIAEDISPSIPDAGKLAPEAPSSLNAEELALEVSDFIAQECEYLREKYQRLLAEVAISGVSSRDARISLFSSFGYRVSLPKALPLAPLVVIFACDFANSVAPILLLPHLEDPDFRLLPQTAALAALAHALGLTLSVLLAVYPKIATNFARPSLFALPWRSYVLFSLIAYLAGTGILWFAYSTIGLSRGWPASSHPFTTAALFSVVFLVNTLVLSILLDVRLRNKLVDFYHARLRDGMTLGIVLSWSMFVFLVVLLKMSTRWGINMPDIWPVYAACVLCFGGLGFVVGYLVPSTAEAYIDSNRLNLQWTEQEGMSIGWATQAQQYRSEVSPVS